MMLKPPVKLVCLITLPLLTTFCQHPASAQDQSTQQNQVVYPSSYVSLKREHQAGGQPVVQAVINSNQPAAFLVDTGASFGILSPEMAKRLHAETHPAVSDDGKPFLWKGKQAVETTVPDVRIGNLNLYNGFFRVLDDQDFMLSSHPTSDDTPFDGVIGSNVLEHFAVLLDPFQHTLGLCLPGNLTLHQVSQAGFTAPHIVPISVESDGLWHVDAQVANGSMTVAEAMVLDTGSNTTQISDTAAQTLHLTITGQQQQVNSYHTHAVGRASVGTLRLGDLTLSGTTVSVSPASMDEPPMLGMDVLSGYRVLIDFPGGKMYLQPNTPTVPMITIKPQTPSVPVGNAGH